MKTVAQRVQVGVESADAEEKTDRPADMMIERGARSVTQRSRGPRKPPPPAVLEREYYAECFCAPDSLLSQWLDLALTES